MDANLGKHFRIPVRAKSCEDVRKYLLSLSCGKAASRKVRSMADGPISRKSFLEDFLFKDIFISAVAAR